MVTGPEDTTYNDLNVTNYQSYTYYITSVDMQGFESVSSDTIKGGISIYILLGFFWAVLYMIMLMLDPDALTNISSTEGTAGFECYYFSFTTLTTLGYGDIVPVAKYARVLATLEAVAGPVYLAIFVAQVIGLNIAQKMKG